MTLSASRQRVHDLVGVRELLGRLRAAFVDLLQTDRPGNLSDRFCNLVGVCKLLGRLCAAFVYFLRTDRLHFLSDGQTGHIVCALLDTGCLRAADINCQRIGELMSSVNALMMLIKTPHMLVCLILCKQDNLFQR